jgi:hypothetical protein
VSAIPDRYRGCAPEDLALSLLADVLDPPAPEQAAADPARWRAAVANVQGALSSPAQMGEAGVGDVAARVAKEATALGLEERRVRISEGRGASPPGIWDPDSRDRSRREAGVAGVAARVAIEATALGLEERRVRISEGRGRPPRNMGPGFAGQESVAVQEPSV